VRPTEPEKRRLTEWAKGVTIISRLSTYPLRNKRAPTLYKDVINAAVRCMLQRITIAQSRYLNPSTSTQYIKKYCKSQGVDPETIVLSTTDGKFAAHWIGRPDAGTVILYLHGGAYTQPANEGNFRYLDRLVKQLNGEQQRGTVSVLMLAYTLAPEAVYPTQLREATAALAYLIVDTRRLPSSILIAGDSAGGNLAMSLISHLHHPRSNVPVVKLEQPLGGLALISPWVSFRTDYSSFENEYLDMLSPLALRKWSAMFLNKGNSANPKADPGPVTGDSWTEACLNNVSWWNILDHVVSDILVWYGSYEVFRVAILDFEEKLKKGWTEGGGDVSRVVFIESAREAHVAPITDTMIPGATKSEAQVVIEEWFGARLEIQGHDY
jgi:acetyl esterase/lipase